MGFKRAASLAVLALAVQAISPSILPDFSQTAIAAPAQTLDPIAATAVRDLTGDPVGKSAYESWTDTIEAGDMAAFLEFTDDDTAGVPETLRIVADTIRAVVNEDLAKAHQIVEGGRTSEDESVSGFMDYLDAWLFALEGDADRAIELHQSAATLLPGLTADLSLASLLEAVGREDQALAVYRALTPGEITAPEDLFDIQGIAFGHIQTVINRRALLLRRQGKIDKAIAVYTRLAEAQPEQAVRYAAAIESLKSGWGLDEEPLNPRTGFTRALFDLSYAAWQSKIINAQRRGIRLTGFDPNKSCLDQLALLIVPEDEDYRSIVANGLQSEALFEGAAHVALSGPQDTPDLLLAASRALLLQQDEDAAKLSLNRAVSFAGNDPAEEFGILSNAASQFMLLGDQGKTFEITNKLLEIARNDAERASVNGQIANIMNHFGRYDEAVEFSREARRLDDTHNRRVALANALGEAGKVEDAMRILKVEALKRPNDPYMLNTLGYFTIEHTEDYASGYRSLARARTMTRTNPYIGDSVGWALYKLGHVDQAIKYIKQARDELAPHLHWEIEDHMGDLLWLQGKKDEAREAWELALTQYPPARVQTKIEAKLAGELEPKSYPKQVIPVLKNDEEGEVASREI